jgi:signal transduction histidine kinase
VIVVAWMALAAYVETFNATHGAPLELALRDWVPGATWLVAGLFAWRRRPDVVIGRVMVVIGFAWFIGGLGGNPWIIGFNQVFQNLDLALVAWLVFAYPTGHIARRYERVYVALVIAWIFSVQTAFALTLNGPTYYHCACPPNALAVFDSPRTYDAIHSVTDPGGAAVAAGVFVLLILRFLKMTPAARRALSALWIGSLLLAVFVIADNIVNNNSAHLSQSAFLLWDRVKDAAYAAIPIAFAVGLLGVRMSRGRVGRLVDDLSTAEGDRLRAALARALGDPSVDVLYRVMGSEGLVDADGQPRAVPTGDPGREVTPLAYRGEQLGVLVHDAALSEQRELIGSVCAALGLSLANQRLQAEIRAQLADVQASRARIVQAGDAERKRIERNLHDGAQQRLVATRLNLRLAASRAGTSDPELGRELQDSIEELEQAISELRTLARGIHPAVLTDEGLAAAVDALVDRAAVPVHVESQLEGRLPADIEAAAYYVVAEALTNVDKYACATSVEVTLTATHHQLCVIVCDDGVGGANPARGSGLRGLDDRVAAAGGRLFVSDQPGGGTCVRAQIPIPVTWTSGPNQ